MLPAGFEPAIPASEMLQTALRCSPSGYFHQYATIIHALTNSTCTPPNTVY